MGNKKFTDLAEAQTAFDNLKAAHDVDTATLKVLNGDLKKITADLTKQNEKFEAEKAAHDSLKDIVKQKDADIASLTTRATEAEKIAQEAIDLVKDQPAVENFNVKVDGKTHLINFGVDGFTRSELKDQKDLLKKLVKIGSGALTLVD